MTTLAMILNYIRSAFSYPKKVATAQLRSSDVREIVRRRSHGNIRLQMGKYYTKKDVDAKYDRISRISFVE